MTIDWYLMYEGEYVADNCIDYGDYMLDEPTRTRFETLTRLIKAAHGVFSVNTAGWLNTMQMLKQLILSVQLFILQHATADLDLTQTKSGPFYDLIQLEWSLLTDRLVTKEKEKQEADEHIWQSSDVSITNDDGFIKPMHDRQRRLKVILACLSMAPVALCEIIIDYASPTWQQVYGPIFFYLNELYSFMTRREETRLVLPVRPPPLTLTRLLPHIGGLVVAITFEIGGTLNPQDTRKFAAMLEHYKPQILDCVNHWTIQPLIKLANTAATFNLELHCS
jgi:hypothetical protein